MACGIFFQENLKWNILLACRISRILNLALQQIIIIIILRILHILYLFHSTCKMASLKGVRVT